ncbi:hypothetical protein EV690_1783 [Celerinatantimonas diazotrophica]|uniref:Uncharacterized protein n=1 Tax=Celerinatantimonas diazotrophica TaxID=412034 RepID=A0A4R1K234_9GAMM|nr:hypothetical protein EV690_1783 [Celerinatantimonas diazotrophica]CAG9297853.1 hypothetical protein CEDIAZO_03045 [Celerinatantimonas diazotrophica]
MNYRLVAVEVGDLLKYDTSVNQINRIGQAIFPFRKENFPNESITSFCSNENDFYVSSGQIHLTTILLIFGYLIEMVGSSRAVDKAFFSVSQRYIASA